MGFEGFIFVGVKYMSRTGRQGGADQILGRISVQDRRTGESTDLMQEVIIHVPIS